jgi:hypothetical protein
MLRPVKSGGEAPLPVGEYFFPFECKNRDGASGSGGSDMLTWTAHVVLNRETFSLADIFHLPTISSSFVVHSTRLLILLISNPKC